MATEWNRICTKLINIGREDLAHKMWSKCTKRKSIIEKHKAIERFSSITDCDVFYVRKEKLCLIFLHLIFLRKF